MDLALLTRLNDIRRARRAAVVVSDLSSGTARLVTDGDDLAGDPLRAEIGDALRSGRSRSVATPAGELFLAAEVPPPRIVVIGAVHISQAMVPIARTIGYDIAIVDPRTAFATPERFPGVDLHADWPETVLPARGGGAHAYTAIAAVTHDPKIDDDALIHAIRQGCFYVGALGSRKTHAKRRERLAAAGIGDADFETIRAPIGLDIAAASPAEIALAVMAEIVEAFRKRVVGQGGSTP